MRIETSNKLELNLQNKKRYIDATRCLMDLWKIKKHKMPLN